MTRNGRGRCVALVSLAVTVAMLSACQDSPTTGRADDGGPISETRMLVTVDPLSGRENPSWQLNSSVAADALACLKQGTASATPDPADPAVLGFRGFTLTSLPPDAPFSDVQVRPESVSGTDATGAHVLITGCEKLFPLLRGDSSHHLSATELSAIPEVRA